MTNTGGSHAKKCGLCRWMCVAATNSSNTNNPQQRPSLVPMHVNMCTAMGRFTSVPWNAHSRGALQSRHYTWQHTSSLPKCQLSEDSCASSELSGVDSPAQLRPSCSAMSTIFWSALSVLLREPEGEEGVTVQPHRALHQSGEGNGGLAVGVTQTHRHSTALQAGPREPSGKGKLL